MEFTEQEKKVIEYAAATKSFQVSDSALLLSLGVSQNRLSQIASSAKKKGALRSVTKTEGSGLKKVNRVFWFLK